MSTGTRKKILVVEDEEPLLEALQDKLGKEGYEVCRAKDGEAGLALALKEHPDLILLDIIVPKMDGLEMANRLREDTWGKTVKILILTNSPSIDDVAKSLENRVFEYLVKSDTTIEYVVEKVKEMVV